jgi:hypothetical protein
MSFGAMQASKANTKVTKQNSILCTLKMANHYIDEKLLTIIVTSGEKLLSNMILLLVDYWDVITFDTTYMTNHYSIPLAMFVGFNNQL